MKRGIVLVLALLILAAVQECVSLGGPAAVRGMWETRDLTAEEALYQGLYDQEETIWLGRYQLDEPALQNLWNRVVCDSPELFYLGGTYEYAMSGGRVLYASPAYTLTGDALADARAEYDRTIADILSGLDEAWTDAETALYLHDYMVTHYTYDESLTGYDAYQMLMEGTGVCQAYTLTYQALLREAGIDCRYVLSDEMDHSWNLVNIDGAWYHADLTFDDPTCDRLGRANHDYFLVSDKKLAADHPGMESPFPCTSTAYDDAAWTAADSGFETVGGTLYAIAGGQLCRWDNGALTPLLSIPDLWYTGGGTAYWDGCFSVLDTDGTLLYYNTPGAIRSYDPAAGVSETVCTYTGDGDIFGFLLAEDGSFTCQIAHSPNEPGSRVRLTGS